MKRKPDDGNPRALNGAEQHHDLKRHKDDSDATHTESGETLSKDMKRTVEQSDADTLIAEQLRALKETG